MSKTVFIGTQSASGALPVYLIPDLFSAIPLAFAPCLPFNPFEPKPNAGMAALEGQAWSASSVQVS